MTWEEWNALSEEDKALRIAEKPTGDDPSGQGDDYVMIGGKKRPLNNFIAEISRKVGEDVMSRLPKPEPKPEPRVTPDNRDIHKQIQDAAEKEMEETGSVVPIRTITSLIQQGTSYILQSQRKIDSEAKKTIKETKRELRTTYKDYNEFSEEFDKILDTIDPAYVKKEGLIMVFDSLRGKKLTEIRAKIEKDKNDNPPPSKKIIGEVDTGTGSGGGSGSGASKGSKLTEAQKEEMQLLNFESEEDYLGRLKKYQEIGVKKGAKNKPTLLQERFILPT